MDTNTLFEFAEKGMRAQAEINKLCLRNGPETSKDAALKMVESGKLNRQEKWVYDKIKKYKNDDFTTKDIAALAREVGINYYRANDICRRRFSGLRDKGKIEITGGRRDGCRIWRLVYRS